MLRVLKLIVLFIISFFASFLLFVLILPSNFDVAHYIEIEKPKKTVLKVLKDIEARKTWYSLVDSNLVSTVNVTGDGDKGSKFSWKHGELEVVSIGEKGVKIIVENKIKFIDYPVDGGWIQYRLNTTGVERFELTEAQQRTSLSWTLSGGPLDYPIGKAVNAAIRYKIYKEAEKALNKLKALAESMKDEEEPKQNTQNNTVVPPFPTQTEQQQQPEPVDSAASNQEQPQDNQQPTE